MTVLTDLLAQALPVDDDAGRFTGSPRAFAALLIGGFLVAIAGHVVRSRPLVALGIAVICAAVATPVLIALWA
ncbi:MAG: hypothetical protein GXY03_06920 [Solirubrobacterales bacterium]|nr:hypothetical protein [Solirubrobacterales bacterium]